MMRKTFLTILSLGLAVGGECLALDVAEKHLKDYQQQRKICGDEDKLATLRLTANYQLLKSWAEVGGGGNLALKDALQTYQDLCAQAYHLAESRYKQGFASVREVYETGAELYRCVENSNLIGSDVSGVTLPSIESLRSMRQTLTRAAEATGSREDWLKTEIIWHFNIDRDFNKIPSYEAELLGILRQRYQQGLISQWELANAELDLQPATSLEQRAADAAELYNRMYEHAAATGDNSYPFTEQLFRARIRQLKAEGTLKMPPRNTPQP